MLRKGELANDVRLAIAEARVAPAPLDQLALLALLTSDPDPQIASAAATTLDRIPRRPLVRFLKRPDVPPAMREFFQLRGVSIDVADPDDEPAAPPVGHGASEDVEPDGETAETAEDAGESGSASQAINLTALTVPQRLQLALRGSRTHRALLIRDPQKTVSMAVLSSPRLSDSEIETFAKMTNVADHVLQTIGQNRSWTRRYNVASSLVRNPKSPIQVALSLLSTLNERDVAAAARDRNIPEPVRIAARKLSAKTRR